MRTVEHIKLNDDTNYIHVKWAVMEVTISGTLATSQAWIKCISYGCDTAENLLAFKLTSEGYEPTLNDAGHPVKQTTYKKRDETGIVGTLGEYRVVTLDSVSEYNRGGKIDFTPNIPLG